MQPTGTELRLVKVDEGAAELHVDIFDGLVRGDGTLRITIPLALNKAIVADSVLLGCGPARLQASLSDAHRCCDVDDGETTLTHGSCGQVQVGDLIHCRVLLFAN